MIKKSLTSEEISQQRAFNNAVHYQTRFKFLRSHCGFRPGASHGLIGTMGSGKSTFLKALGHEIALEGPVHWHLSEESVAQYQPDLMICDPFGTSMRNICWTEEGDLPNFVTDNQKNFHEWYLDSLNDSKAKFAIIDNITSSLFYSDDVGLHGQAATIKLFDYITKRMGVGLFWAAHTGTHIKDNHHDIVRPEDIRGSRQLPLRTPYFYSFQKYTAEEESFRILTVHKHRFHKDSGGHYLLNFREGSYDRDESIPFSFIKSIFKKRDKL